MDWRASCAEALSATLLVLCACHDEAFVPPRMHDSAAVNVASMDAGFDASPPPEDPPPRPVPDLRFKWVGEHAFNYRTTLTSNVFAASDSFLGPTVVSGSIALTPLELRLHPRRRHMPTPDADAGVDVDQGSDDWLYSFFDVIPRVADLSALVSGGVMSVFDRDLVRTFSRQQKIVTSFDLALAASEARDAYAVTAIGRADRQPIYNHATVGRTPRSELANVLQLEAREGRIATALSGDGAQVTYFSYDWIGDSSRYETRVLAADFETLEDRARQLADDGFVITAFGRDAEVLVLVGTRVEGRSEPRSIELLQEDRLPLKLPGPVVARVSNGDGIRKVIVQH